MNTSNTSRAADAITHYLTELIQNGELAHNATIPSERSLMAQFQASRAVVREAITVLSSQGLIENRPRYRPRVRKLGFESAMQALDVFATQLLTHPDNVRDLYQTRIFIERLLVRDAALTARKTDIQKLTAALEKNRLAVADTELFYETDMGFHRVLYEINGNPVFLALHQSYHRWLKSRWVKMAQSEHRNYVNYCSHKEVHQAIVDRDADAAEAALLNHLNAAWEYLKVTFN